MSTLEASFGPKCLLLSLNVSVICTEDPKLGLTYKRANIKFCHKVTKDEPALLTMPPYKYRLCMSMKISSHISKELTQISYGMLSKYAFKICGRSWT